MVTIQTDLGNLKEPARRERFEPTGNRHGRVRFSRSIP